MRMCMIVIVLTMVANAIPAMAEPFELMGEWWRAPAETSRHSTLVCSFDSAEDHDADYAREFAGAGGFGMDATVEGAHGLCTMVAEPGGHLNFRGDGNFQHLHGTMRLLVRGDAWADETPRWFVEARGNDRIGILREPGVLSLVFSPGRRTDQPIAKLDLEVGEVSTDEWHSIVASWDRDAGTGWIALDGSGVSGPMEFSDDDRAAWAIYVAGGFGGRTGGLNLPGLAIDELVLYDAALPVLEADVPLPEEDEQFLPMAEAGARDTLYFLADLQRYGGWQCIYTWPTLLGGSYQGRESISDEYYIDNDKGNGSPRTAINLLYGYEVLGDARFLDAAMRTAEFLLAAQDERGFWVHGYRMTVHGIQPAASDRHIKLQDLVQAHPSFYLAYVYRVTDDERYLDAIKRAGEWLIEAQNPNGSWSHHYDAEEGVGKNARGEPGAGEINDATMNSGIDMMAFMYQMTGEAKYVEAMKRAGDWLIEAQGDEVPLWAMQYDPEDNPQWARHFEPPAWSISGTRQAITALREMYRFSADERYLDAIKRSMQWMEENLPEGRMYNHVEPETGRPVAAWQREIYYLDNPEHVAYLETVPIGSGYTKEGEILDWTRDRVEQAQSLPSWPEVTPESALESLPDRRGGAQSALETQHPEAPVWITERFANFMGSIGRAFAAYSPRTLLMLRYIERARIAKGEIEPVYRGDGDLQRAAYPEDDWYEVDWAEHIGGQ
ncbi:MAG: pectate lyase [Armatimonadota bacterium]